MIPYTFDNQYLKTSQFSMCIMFKKKIRYSCYLIFRTIDKSHFVLYICVCVYFSFSSCYLSVYIYIYSQVWRESVFVFNILGIFFSCFLYNFCPLLYILLKTPSRPSYRFLLHFTERCIFCSLIHMKLRIEFPD